MKLNKGYIEYQNKFHKRYLKKNSLILGLFNLVLLIILATNEKDKIRK
jgi:hypothetical protein